MPTFPKGALRTQALQLCCAKGSGPTALEALRTSIRGKALSLCLSHDACIHLMTNPFRTIHVLLSARDTSEEKLTSLPRTVSVSLTSLVYPKACMLHPTFLTGFFSSLPSPCSMP